MFDPYRVVESYSNQTGRLRAPFEALSDEAQTKLGKLMESLDPLGKLLAGARSGGCKTTAPLKRQRGRDLRLPKPGDILSRRYQGQEIVVRVLESGFEFAGRRFRSLPLIPTIALGPSS